ncbi:MAG: trypsin-like peptidase domain-containing protein [Myxococcota bacterium]
MKTWPEEILGAKFVSFFAAALVLASSMAAHAQGDALLEDERNSIQVFQNVSDSVTFITSNQLSRDFFNRNVMEVPHGSGSGFIWDHDGHIVTNSHVIQDATSVVVTLANGTQHRASLIGIDPTKDIAVLRIRAPRNILKPVVLGDSQKLLVGQKVLAIGNPFGLDRTLTTGVISALGREIQSIAKTTIQDVIQTDASINPGNSGGPLLDSRGRLVGVNTAIFSPSGTSAGIGFAVPVGTVKRVVPQIIRFGHVKRAGLGVTLIPDDLAQRWRIRGVVIREVGPNTTAARAGLRASSVGRRGEVSLGDIIVGINRQKVEKYDDLFQVLDEHKPGDTVILEILRNDRRLQVQLVLQEIN